jgi:hypothetical protein
MTQALYALMNNKTIKKENKMLSGRNQSQNSTLKNNKLQ